MFLKGKMNEICVLKEDYEEMIRMIDNDEEMIDEIDHEVYEVLDCTTDENDRLKE